jgi:hypothetical protein
LLRFGEPPPAISSGEAYAPPHRGMFSASIAMPRAALFSSTLLEPLLIQLVWLAEKVNEQERATYWGARGLVMAREGDHQVILATLDYANLPALVQGDRYSDALYAAVEGTALIQALQNVYKPDSDPLHMHVDVEAALGPKSNAQWLEVERLAAVLSLAPIALRLGMLWQIDRDLCILGAVDVAAACRDVALTASNTQLWNTAAALLEGVFVHPISLADLEKRCHEAPMPEQPGLLFICNLGMTLTEQISLRDAKKIHEDLLKFVQNSLGPLTGIETRLFAPFLQEYWRNAFQRKRLLFRTPGFVESEMETACLAAPGERARAILTAVGYGV